jgi:release factor glutamine methyltransferase
VWSKKFAEGAIYLIHYFVFQYSYMQSSEAHQRLLQSLSQYDALEAQSISRIVLKDVFQTEHRANKVLGVEHIEMLESICTRLKAGEPVQYVTGWADFYGMKFRVSPQVLIPRQETETLVETCLAHLKRTDQPEAEILDIGTGSGCIAISLASKLKKARVFALDISAEALLVAEANATLHNAHVGLVQHDVRKETPLPLRGFDLIVSNPPYIPEAEKSLMQANVLAFEPHLALFVADSDPLEFYRIIIKHAQHHLYEGGMLAFECNEFNAKSVLAMMQEAGMKECQLIQDLSGADRVVTGVN